MCVCVQHAQHGDHSLLHAAPMDASHTPSPVFSTPGMFLWGLFFVLELLLATDAFCLRLHCKDP